LHKIVELAQLEFKGIPFYSESVQKWSFFSTSIFLNIAIFLTVNSLT